MPSHVTAFGAIVPTRSANISPAARDVLLAIQQTMNLVNLAPEEDAVRRDVLRLYADIGRAPTVSELASHSGLTESAIGAVLMILRQRDCIVLDSNDERIIGAYPFTESDTEHLIRLGDRTLKAMCAIDALGIGTMLGRDIAIDSRCRACGAPVRITTRDLGRSLAGVHPKTTVVWSGLRCEGGCAANSLCPTIAFFCADDHLDAWRTKQPADAQGLRLSLDEAFALGCAIFGPSLTGPHPR